MKRFARCFVILIFLWFIAPLAGADVSFLALQQVGDDWDFGLYTEADDLKPGASGDANIVSGLALFWELSYDGSSMLTYSWGSSADSLDSSIDYYLGPIDFDYLYVGAHTKLNSKPTAIVQDLVLQTDAGILEAETLESGWGNNNSHLFTYNNPITFGSFTLSGFTTFTWNGKGSNSDDLAVIISGGNSSPVVDEPMSAAILLIGMAGLALRTMRRRGQKVSVPAAA